MKYKIPLISVCIPAYNRSDLLSELLDSIILQNFNNFEIVVCEDNSPQRDEIAKIIRRYRKIKPGLIRYFENPSNLGYDNNLRNLIHKSRGEYCLFMGNDDLMCKGALKKVAFALNRYQNIGVLLRSYAAFDGDPKNIVQIFRYFDHELFFPAGANTICTIYRRSVVIPGMVVHRASARKWDTDRFDGTLLYQLYLVANILVDMNAIYLPDVIVLYRNGGVPDFGNSASEKSKFLPKEQTPESSIHFIQGMIDIAKDIERIHQIPVFKIIMRDIANYSYPIVAIQAHRSLPVFFRYVWSLAHLGFARYPLFYMWFIIILILGKKQTDYIISLIKKCLGHTPILGDIYQGETP
jgi:glycosyltransferase involved in cell wall biosynthesis